MVSQKAGEITPLNATDTPLKQKAENSANEINLIGIL